MSREHIARQAFNRPYNLPIGRQGLKVAQADVAVSGVKTAEGSRHFCLLTAQCIVAGWRVLVPGNKHRNRVAQQEVHRVGIGGTGRGVRQLVNDQPVTLLLCTDAAA